MYTNDDFVISSNGWVYSLGSEDYGFQGEFESVSDALEAFKNWTEDNNYWPSLYFMSDHGNVDAIDYEGNIIQEA